MPDAARQFRKQYRNGSKRNKPAHERGYDSQWNRISRLKRQQNPLCEYCGTAVATEVHHVVPFRGLKDPLRTAWDNLKATCAACHQAQHKGEI